MAKKALNLPQSSRSGTSINSKIFMTATTTICVMAFHLGLKRDKIQRAMTISEMPMRTVKGLAYSSPKMLATIS